MKVILKIFGLFILLLVTGTINAKMKFDSPFEVVWDNEKIEVGVGQDFQTSVVVNVPSGHYLYADKTDLDFTSLEGIRIKDVRYPKSVEREDSFLKKKMEVFDKNVRIDILGYVPKSLEKGEKELTAHLKFQGCTPKLCLRPEEKKIEFRVEVLATAVGKSEKMVVEEPKSIISLISTRDFNQVLGQGILVSVVVVFLGGMIVSLTPCVWPIIPIILLIIGVESQKKWYKNTLLSLLFVTGLVVVNSLLGIMAVAFGKTIGFLFQSKLFLFLVILFFVLMSISMFGFFEFNIFKRFHGRISRIGGKGPLGALLMGMTTGLIVSPCASPVVASLLAYVGIRQSYLLGFMLLIVFGLGMGVLFVIFGSAFGTFAGKLKGGKWTIWAKRSLGVVLLFPVIFYMRSLVRWNGVYHTGVDTGAPRIEWVTSLDDGLKFAKESKRPAMIEFYADWCQPCRQLESSFFKRSDVVKLSYQLVPIRIDATVMRPEVKEAIKKYNVIGWPSIYFVSPDGGLIEDLTVISADTKKIEASIQNAITRVSK